MYKVGKKIKIKAGIYSCLDDSFMELNVENETELEIIADVSEEKKVIVNGSKRQPAVRIAIPYHRIAA